MAALRPPSNPDETFNRDDVDLDKIRTWNKSFAVSMLAGLSTEPAFHANGIRIDWLQRLVFSKSQGQRKPSSAELSRALNAGLDRAGVLRLEYPSEDLFCEMIATSRGNYRIFPGQWEAAAPYTQTLLDAFESLPSGYLTRHRPVANRGRAFADRDHILDLPPPFASPAAMPGVAHRALRAQILRQLFLKHTAGLHE